MKAQSFEEWMRAVDQYVWKFAGCSVYDLADWRFRDWYDDGTNAASAARQAIRYDRGEQ
jgi:hypothetical protein